MSELEQIVQFLFWDKSLDEFSNCVRFVDTSWEDTECPTRYRTRRFFNNSNTNEDIATKFEQEYVRCVRNVTTSEHMLEVATICVPTGLIKLLKKCQVR
jgi:lysyl-tRNA synthetase class II